MTTRRMPARLVASLTRGMLLAIVACASASAQTLTPTPTGEFLCSAGPRDGQACSTDSDCAPDGVCVIAVGLCVGGADDGLFCDCIAASCSSTPACSTDATFGTCQGGVNTDLCCDVTHNCASGSPCVGTQKLCIGGSDIGSICLRDDQCPGSLCWSTGKFCNGGDFDSFTCVDDVDCNNADGSQGGICTTASTPAPTGEFLCSAGPRDGEACNTDSDCAPDGVCVIAVGLCVGGADDGLSCGCIAGSCSSTAACSTDVTFGTCQGGVNSGLCCDVTHNCAGGNPCVGTQKLCIGGDDIGFACFSDDQCPASVCRATGTVCSGGDFDSFPCVDDNDCTNVDGSAGGICVGVATSCAGDCDGGGGVTINEIITMVNIALGSAEPATCAAGIPSGLQVNVALILQAVNHALNGCPRVNITGTWNRTNQTLETTAVQTLVQDGSSVTGTTVASVVQACIQAGA